MPKDSMEWRCPICNGGSLVHGRVGAFGFVFHPFSGSTIFGYPIDRACACPDCGFVGQFLRESSLAKLRRNPSPHPEQGSPATSDS